LTDDVQNKSFKIGEESILTHEKENIDNFSQNSLKKFDHDSPSQITSEFSMSLYSISIPFTRFHFFICSENSSADVFFTNSDEFEFDLSEEDLRRIDQEVSQKIAVRIVFPVFLSLKKGVLIFSCSLKQTQAPVFTHPVSGRKSNSPGQSIEVISTEDWALFEELEKQALEKAFTQQHQQPTTITIKPEEERHSPEEISDEILEQLLIRHSSDITQHEQNIVSREEESHQPQHNNNIIFCMRLKAKEVQEDTRLRTKIITCLFEDENPILKSKKNGNTTDSTVSKNPLSVASNMEVVTVLLSGDW
jgi:hypothetical protein